MKKSITDNTDYPPDNTAKTTAQEEMHCTKCGTYLGIYGPGSNGTVPCPKCREPNVIDYTGKEFIVKRLGRA